MTEQTSEQQQALRRLAAVTATRASVEEQWRAEIVRARDAGLSLRAIADAAGVSNPRVHQIINREESTS